MPVGTSAKKGVISELNNACSITFERACAAAEQYEALSSQIKMLEKRRDELKAEFMEFSKVYGQPNENGSLYFKDNRGYMIGSMRRVSYSLDPERAKEFLEARRLLEEAQTMRIDPDKLKALAALGKITEEEYASLFDAKVSFAASVVSPEKAAKYGASE